MNPKINAVISEYRTKLFLHFKLFSIKDIKYKNIKVKIVADSEKIMQAYEIFIKGLQNNSLT